MAIEQLKIHEIVNQAVGKTVDTPEFQREFVWDPTQVKLLVESLYRDYPIGSFLLWDSVKYQEAKIAQSSQASRWIIDGQKRTTALCLLLGMKPYWWPVAEDWNKALERYNILMNIYPERGKEDLEFALPNPVRSRDPCWISVQSVLKINDVEDLTSKAEQLVGEINNDPQEQFSIIRKVHGRLQKLWQIRERDIPIVKINHEVEDVSEIFTRLNREGTRVKAADVVLAAVAVTNPGWVRDNYLPYQNELREKGWDLDAGIFIRTMTGLGYGRAKLSEVPKDFRKPENITSIWKNAGRSITETLKRLAEYGILSVDILPSTNSLIPLFILHYRWSNSGSYNFKKALYWFLLANWDGRYNGSAMTTLTEDFRAILDAENFEDAISSLLGRLQVSKIIVEEDFLNRYDQAGNRFLRLMLYLVLFKQEARDWVDGTRLGYEKSGSLIARGFEPQFHHIYPRNVLRKAEIKDDDVHALANITVLNEQTNVNKLSGKEPSVYIKKFNIFPPNLRSHQIPESFITPYTIEERWAISRYNQFLVDRALLLANRANELLKELQE